MNAHDDQTLQNGQDWLHLDIIVLYFLAQLERLRALRRRPVLKSAAGAGWFGLSCRTTGAKGEGGLSRGEVSPGVFSLTVLMFLKLLIVLTEVISAEGRLRRFQVQSKAQPQCICNG